MPMVGDMLRQLTGLEPDHTVNPDEAVARGAALYAAYLLGKESGGHAQFKITNVNSHSLGVEGIAPETLRKTNVVLIPRNTPLPAKFTEQFATKAENQRSIVVQILEGESPQPGDCTVIGRTAIHNLPEGLPKNWPIEVTFEYAANGRLSVEAVVTGTNQTATLNLERAAGMSDEGISRWKQAIDASAGFQAFETMVEDVMDAVEPDEPVPAKIATKPAAKSRVSASKDEDFDSIVQDVLEEMPMPNDNGTPHSGSKASSSAPTSSPLPREEAIPVNTPDPDAEGKSETAANAGPAEDSSKKQEEAAADEVKKPSPEDLLPIPRWLFSLIGHVCAALIGLALGYLVLHWLRPGKFPLPENFPWLG
jgi:molecular chaperone DnaK